MVGADAAGTTSCPTSVPAVAAIRAVDADAAGAGHTPQVAVLPAPPPAKREPQKQPVRTTTGFLLLLSAGKSVNALGKDVSECHPQHTSHNNLRLDKTVFAECFSSGTRQSFAKC